MSIPLIPDWFDTATNFFYGTPAGGPETTALWDDFLQSESAASYVTIDTVTKKKVLLPGKESDPTVQSLYLDFLRAQLSKVYQNESINLISPTEIEQRRLVFTIFDILQTMLKSAITTQLTVGSTMDFLTKKQKSYADLMARTFFYMGTGSIDTDYSVGGEYVSSADWYNTPVNYSTDPQKYDLGYGNIKLSEIADWCATNVDNTTATTDSPKTSFNPSPGITPMFVTTTTQFYLDFYKGNGEVDGQTDATLTMNIYLKRLPDGTVEVKAALLHTSSDQKIGSRSLQYPVTTDFVSNVTTTTGDATAIQKAVTDAYYAAYNQAKNAGIPFDSHHLMIPYQPGILAGTVSEYHDSDTQKTDAKLAQLTAKRGALNQSLSTYVEGLRSKMDLYGDKRDQVKQLLDSSIQMRKMTTQIITACISQMTNILSSIFR